MNNTPALLVSIAAALIGLFAVYLHYQNRKERVSAEIHSIRTDIQEEIARHYATRRSCILNIKLLKAIWIKSGNDTNPAIVALDGVKEMFDEEFLHLQALEIAVDAVLNSSDRPEVKLRVLREDYHALLVKMVRESEGVEKHTFNTLGLLRENVAS